MLFRLRCAAIPKHAVDQYAGKTCVRLSLLWSSFSHACLTARLPASLCGVSFTMLDPGPGRRPVRCDCSYRKPITAFIVPKYLPAVEARLVVDCCFFTFTQKSDSQVVS